MRLTMSLTRSEQIDRKRIVNDGAHRSEIIGLPIRHAHCEIGEGKDEKRATHEVPFGITAPHPLKLGLP